MRFLPLTQGQYAIVDNGDFNSVSKFKWYAVWGKHVKSFYAVRTIRLSGYRRLSILLHRAIMGVTDRHLRVDHENHNTLDCRKHNLRVCTNSQNMQNRKGPNKGSLSGIRGVTWDGARGKWKSQLTICRKNIYLGAFKDKKEAEAVAIAGRIKYFGKFSREVS